MPLRRATHGRSGRASCPIPRSQPLPAKEERNVKPGAEAPGRGQQEACACRFTCAPRVLAIRKQGRGVRLIDLKSLNITNAGEK